MQVSRTNCALTESMTAMSSANDDQLVSKYTRLAYACYVNGFTQPNETKIWFTCLLNYCKTLQFGCHGDYILEVILVN